jgi:hypothetical protein
MKVIPHPDKSRSARVVKMGPNDEIGVVEFIHFAKENNLIEVPMEGIDATDDNSGIWFQFGDNMPSMYYVGFLKRQIPGALRCRMNLTLSHEKNLFYKEPPCKAA